MKKHFVDCEFNSSDGFDFFRAKDHEVASYETEQIVDVPGAEDMQSGGKPSTCQLKCSLLKRLFCYLQSSSKGNLHFYNKKALNCLK